MNTAQLIEKGTELFSKLQLKEAGECFSNALEIDPRSTSALIWLGRIAVIQRRMDEGDRLFDQAISINPNESEALTLRGVNELERNKPERALEFFIKATESNSGLEIYGYFARCYALLGNRVEAEKAARKALKTNAHDSMAHYELARILADQNKPVEAITHLVDSINSNPLFVKGYFALGELFTMAGKSEEALNVYRKGLSFMPDAHILREQLSGLLAAKGDFQGAIEETNECIRRRNSYNDHFRLGLYSLIAGQVETAEMAFLKSLELNPQNWEAHYALGEIYSAANLVNESHAQYEAALLKGKDEWKPHNGMGVWMMRNKQNPTDAKSEFVKASKLDPSRPEPLLNLALIAAAQREWKEASSQCNKIKQIVPSESKFFQEAERLITAIQAKMIS